MLTDPEIRGVFVRHSGRLSTSSAGQGRYRDNDNGPPEGSHREYRSFPPSWKGQIRARLPPLGGVHPPPTNDRDLALASSVPRHAAPSRVTKGASPARPDRRESRHFPPVKPGAETQVMVQDAKVLVSGLLGLDLDYVTYSTRGGWKPGFQRHKRTKKGLPLMRQQVSMTAEDAVAESQKRG
jgi:hypothetical protein